MPPPTNLMVIWLDFEEGKDSYKAESAKPNPKFLSAATVNQVFNQAEVSIVVETLQLKARNNFHLY